MSTKITTKTKVKSLYLFLFIFPCIGIVQAVNTLKFDAIKDEHSSASGSTYQSIIDRDNFLWFGSEIGLHRYDGNEFKTFHQLVEINEKHYLGHVRCVLEDKIGNIWFGAANGLYIYNKQNERITKFNFELEEKQKLQASRIRAIYQNEKNIMWFGSYYGLSKYNIETGLQSSYNHYPIRNILQIDNNTLIIGTLNNGVYLFDIKTNEFEKLNIPDLNNISILDTFKDNNGDIWIASWGKGVYKIESGSRIVTPVNIGGANLNVSSIEQIDASSLWFGTRAGLIVYNINSESYEVISNLSGESGISESNYIRDIDVFNDAVLISTYDSGIYRYNKKRKQFEYYSTNLDKTKGLKNKVVYAIGELNGLIYIGGKSGQFIEFSPLNKSFRHIVLTLDGQHFNQNIYNMVNLSNGHIIAKSDSFIFQIDPKKDSIEITKTPNFDFLNSFQNLLFISSKKNNPPILTRQNLIFLIDTVKDADLEITNQYKIDSSRPTHAAYKGGEVYIGGVFGSIDRISIKTGNIVNVRKPDNTRILALEINNSGEIVLGTADKGVLIEKNNKTLRSFNESKGLPSKTVVGMILDDSKNNIWVSTNRGISKIRADNKTIHFGESDGLQSEEFNVSSLKATDGSYYFGGVNGFNRFFPEGIIPMGKPSNVNITNLYLDSVAQSPQNKKSIINKSINSLKFISLTHAQNSIGFEFSSFGNEAPNKLQYYFRLVGLNNEWQQVNFRKRYANYINLNSGVYRFEVKTKSINGLWSPETKVVKIKISPPWWKTPMAYVAYILICIFSVYIFIQHRTRLLLNRAKILQEIVNDRTRELASEKSKVEKLLAKKNDEFTNVSHEFRTPLTLILGPLKNFIRKYQDKVDTSELSVIERNSQRLLRMVNQMLNMETLKVNAITKRTPENFFSATALAVKAFSSVASEKDIQLTLIQKQEVCFDFTPDAYEKIILNLLSNAIKYTEPHGEVIVTTERNKKNQFILTVKDNGIGIADDKQASVFERFNRVINEDSERVTGAGIGLALVKDLVKAHDGRVELESELGKGTKISVFLPIINEVEASQVDLHENKELAAMELMALTENQAQNDSDRLNLEDDSRKPSVLVIEDNADMRHYIESNINNIYQVLTAKNGDEGVKLAESEVPDLIISDIMMPKMNGYQVTRALRENQATSHIPIILLTAKSDLESRIRGWQENADEYLTKPFSIEELLIRLKNLLDIRDILKKRFADVAFSLPDKPSTNQQPSNQEEDQHEFLIKVNSILDEIYKDSDVKIKDVSARIAMSDRQFHRKLKSIVDLSPNEYLRRYRLEKAKELLVQGKSANYAAFEVGFSSQSYFGRCFKALYGCSPSEINKQNLN